MNAFRQKLKEIPLLGRLLKILHYAATGGWKRDPALLIGKEIKQKRAFVLQIGSNDGATGDPVFRLMKKRPAWQGLFVEPVPYLFRRLKKNYGDSPRFRFENSAVNDGREEMFYWVDPRAGKEIPGLPEWWEQLGSFRPGYIQEILGQGISPYIRETVIKGVTLPELVSKHRIDSINVLHVDTEGYEWKILKQLINITIRPRIILFEHKHLSSEDRRAILKFLESEYSVCDLGEDYYCRHCASEKGARNS